MIYKQIIYYSLQNGIRAHIKFLKEEQMMTKLGKKNKAIKRPKYSVTSKNDIYK